jgi:endo-1,4-beta-D-glucanase Y
MIRVNSLIALILLPTALIAVTNFPFPQKNAKYPYGIVPTTVDPAKIQKAYDEFMKLYEEDNATGLARIKHDQTANTVSEGIGYGMMILVYMDNDQNKTQAKFDKLWAYYNKYLDTKGLMNWKIVGFTGPATDGKNSATDAELDAAVGLMQAYKQWGDEKYLKDAKDLIAKIAKEEVNKTRYLKPGDSWDSEKNPSYFSTAALQLFKNVSTFGWDTVVNNSYTLIKKVQNSTTGLIPNWCSEQGVPSAASSYDENRGAYTYDATRTPWRMAWAYSWYGHKDAKDICTKLASWIKTTTSNDPTNVVDGYKLDGTDIGGYVNTTFVGPFGCAGMVDATHQAWVDKSYNLLTTMTEAKYYQISLKILTLLYLSGNMPDLWSPTTSVQDKKVSSSEKISISLCTISRSSIPQVTFTTTESGKVTIQLISLKGELLLVVSDRMFQAGNHTVAIDTHLGTGSYIIKVRTTAGEQSAHLSVVR